MDNKFNRIKEISKGQYLKSGHWAFPISSPSFKVFEEKIFVYGDQDFKIGIFDSNGKGLINIKRPYNKIPVTKEYKKGLYEYFKKITEKPFYEMLKKMITFKPTFSKLITERFM